MQHSINFPSIESKLLLSIKVSCASNFKLLVKNTTLQASFEKLRTLRHSTNPENDFRFVQFFFIHPVVSLQKLGWADTFDTYCIHTGLYHKTIENRMVARKGADELKFSFITITI